MSEIKGPNEEIEVVEQPLESPKERAVRIIRDELGFYNKELFEEEMFSFSKSSMSETETSGEIRSGVNAVLGEENSDETLGESGDSSNLLGFVMAGADPVEVLMHMVTSAEPGRRAVMTARLSQVAMKDFDTNVLYRLCMELIRGDIHVCSLHVGEMLKKKFKEDEDLGSEETLKLLQELDRIMGNFDGDRLENNMQKWVMYILGYLGMAVVDSSEASIDDELCRELVKVAGAGMIKTLDLWLKFLTDVGSDDARFIRHTRGLTHVLKRGGAEYDFTNYENLLLELYNSDKKMDDYKAVVEDSILAFDTENEKLAEIKRQTLSVYMLAWKWTFTNDLLNEWHEGGDPKLSQWAESVFLAYDDDGLIDFDRVFNVRSELVLKSRMELPWELKMRLALVGNGSRSEIISQLLAENLSEEQEYEFFTEFWKAQMVEPDEPDLIFEMFRDNRNGVYEVNFTHNYERGADSYSMTASWGVVVEKIVKPKMGKGFEEFYERLIEEIHGDEELRDYTLLANYYLYTLATADENFSREFYDLIPLIHRMGFSLGNHESGNSTLNRLFAANTASLIHDPVIIERTIEAIYGGIVGDPIDKYQEVSDEELINSLWQFNSLFNVNPDLPEWMREVVEGENLTCQHIEYERLVVLSSRSSGAVVEFFENLEGNRNWMMSYMGVKYLYENGKLTEEKILELRNKRTDVAAICTLWLRDYVFTNDWGKLAAVINAACEEFSLDYNPSLAAVDALVNRLNSEENSSDEDFYGLSSKVADWVKEQDPDYWVRQEIERRVDLDRFTVVHNWEDEWEEVLY